MGFTLKAADIIPFHVSIITNDLLFLQNLDQ